MKLRNLDLSAMLSSADADSLLSALGMDQFLYDAASQCVRTDAKYTPSTNGWKNGQLVVSYQLKDLLPLVQNVISVCSSSNS